MTREEAIEKLRELQRKVESGETQGAMGHYYADGVPTLSALTVPIEIVRGVTGERFDGDEADWEVFDTDEDKVVLTGTQIECERWAIRHNKKVIGAGGSPCFVAREVEESGHRRWPCCKCGKPMSDDEVIFADKDGDTWADENPPKLAWCEGCLPAQQDGGGP